MKGVALLFILSGLFSCQQKLSVDEGVSLELARQRKTQLGNIIYNLKLEIPADKSEPITGLMKITFDYSGNKDLVLDFKVSKEKIKNISAEDEINFHFENGHIVIPESELKQNRNEIAIEFVAGDLSLNRNDDFLYTLFVPDRASTAFPLFDQPDLKGIYNLTLTIPSHWVALANGELLAKDSAENKITYYFRETAPLPTYLFAFVAGEFSRMTSTKNGRTIILLHRETDSLKVARNVEEVFDLHFQALGWLEEYTGISYPFEKFAFALIPSFQYGGMEHPGTILYNANGLLLDESHTQSQLLGRASVIAHETAHMWFGDLVTMEWFNDVWMKEVFANFMAAKIINPAFPEIDHNLRFLMAHYPSAYSVDRTPGANPIQQPLDNLKNAGQMYGAIIYQKAPIVMKHLEKLVGEEIFRESLQQYLITYSYDNANWDDLVSIIDNNSEVDVKTWSEAWVKEPGMPRIESIFSAENQSLQITQKDDLTLRPQSVSWLIKYKESEELQKIFLWNKKSELKLSSSEIPAFIIPNPDGFGYGHFQLDQPSKNYLLNHAGEISDQVTRGSAWITLNESMLRYEIEPVDLLTSVKNFLPAENELQNAQYLLNIIGNIFWRYLPEETRAGFGAGLEKLLLNEMASRKTSREKAMFYRAFVNIAGSAAAISLMKDWWSGKQVIEGLLFSENDFTQLAYELAVREVENSREILFTQLENIKNPDRKARMEFVIPALSPNAEIRAQFFESLKLEVNREHEPWVLEAIRYLHHPLRSGESIQFIMPSLELLEEIQRTGDIFFPTRWLANTFSGHNSMEAAGLVKEFLEKHPDYPEKLREKILQSSDQLFRASEWLKISTESNLLD